MPELPEMENYRRLLSGLIVGRPITGTEITREKSINLDPEEFDRLLQGQAIRRIDRRAKHLLFALESGDTMVLHLMLGGIICYGTLQEKPDRTVQVRISFGDRHLYLIGLRLGYLHVLGPEQLIEALAKLGPEPYDPMLTPPVFLEKLADRKGTLKSTLVDQSFVAGIGNCYSDEICFAAGLLPERKPASLSTAEALRLFHSMREVLDEATNWGGYMELPLYPGDRLTGGFDSRCRVYDREGEPCVRCGALIQRREISSKKSFFCLGCQS
ncbi:formamidopyrimidine-DNA glycosylase [Paenibacillus sp. UNCCL117]|uniref:Fpg/Nei family DNA glycosylase n=1 Tax=unclassified Paenibacillus TaxID=185978 RepID=UPI00088ECDFB|nr:MULTISPECIES: DNA-formamidopyrimidine glycosylase family protein [unclassified Paenibacillus]SDC47345.1 formamidopyrimidine-DNA glycosylase [Paenibacillus sp. cl123]SFW12145.1 formamidopyrimidine-DNA glycosylase [Paenibacillus sp. UNCCL117]